MSFGLFVLPPGATIPLLTTVGGLPIVVIDGAIPPRIVTEAPLALAEKAAFRRVEASSPRHLQQVHAVTEHDAGAFMATPLYKRIATLLRALFPASPLYPERIYTNAMQARSPMKEQLGEVRRVPGRSTTHTRSCSVEVQ